MATPLYELRRRVRERLLEPFALVTPGAPNVSPQGTPGTTTVAYKIVAVNATGTSIASQAKTIATSAATLTSTNYNQLTWTAVLGASSYNIYRTDAPVVPTTLGKIGNTTSTTFNDTGLAGDETTEPTENTSGITSPFWNDDDLVKYLIDGAKDLWRAVIDLHRNHFTTNDATNVSLVASGTSLTGVPADCFRVLRIEPRDLTQSGSFRNVVFRPKPMQGERFQYARTLGTVSPAEYEIYFDLLNAGSPVVAPSIVVAPASSSTIPLRLIYVHTLPALTEESNNPIPGESDNALIAWAVAYGRSLEREDRMPDPAWLAIYGTDKQSLLTSLTPRQEQEIEIVEDLFAPNWGWQ